MTFSQPQTPAPVQTPRKGKRRWLLPVLALTGGLLIGSAAGGSKPPEIRTVEKTVPGPERIVEKKVEVPVPTTPRECITALDHADKGFGILSEILGHVGNMDWAAVDRSNAELRALVPKYGAAKATCRAGA